MWKSSCARRPRTAADAARFACGRPCEEASFLKEPEVIRANASSRIGRTLLFLLTAWCLHAVALGADKDAAFPVQSNLRAGVAKVDITPADTDGVTVVGHHRVVHGVRDPLRAGVLILDDGATKAAIVTLDTIGAWDEMVRLARQRIEKEAGVPAANILIAASHNHSGPGFTVDGAWGKELIAKLG